MHSCVYNNWNGTTQISCIWIQTHSTLNLLLMQVGQEDHRSPRRLLPGRRVHGVHCVHGIFISWDNRMLQQLTVDVCSCFPAVLTRKYGCDMAVVGLLQAQTLGNSPTALCYNLHEVHSEEWMRKQLSYLGDSERHRYLTYMYNVYTCAVTHHPFRKRHLLGAAVTRYEEAAPFPRFPGPKWFLVVYTCDVWSRLPELQAAVISVFGSILKVDSTKKVCIFNRL